LPRRLALTLLLACVALVACGPAPAAEVLTRPAATPAPQRQSPTLAPPPTASPPATVPSPSPTAGQAPTPTPTAPHVGVQVGHWRLKDLPDELANIRGDSGTYYRGYDEWEVNIEIAQRLQRRLEAAGVVVDLLPATVPAAYQADAFVAIHCDGVNGASAERRRGWKAATPFRSSPAAEALLEAVEASYGRVTGMPQDTRGASFEMRAYYAFAAYRYQHTIAPTTPAIIVEAGFVTHPEDRALLFDNPDLVAQGIAEGLLAYLASRDPAATRPPQLPALSVADDVTLFERPSQSAAIVRALDPGEALVTLSRTDGWYLVTTREGWDIGWVRASEVQT
jgi:hypothetical protein